ncbi:MAG: hemerythrin domain-containing protein [Alphaproteobacteria bacterium]|nr:hemerythrin domain-containing protein [Alphaproteobacteria bacterium]
MDAITLLRDDHKTLRKLTSDLADTTERAVETRKKLLDRIEAFLKAHTTIEEELFYPAYIAASDGDIEAKRQVAEGVEEHRAADRKVIPDLRKNDPSTVQWSGDAKVLKDYVFHHLGEEEEEIFPKMRELMKPAELKKLGEAMLARKEELLAQERA